MKRGDLVKAIKNITPFQLLGCIGVIISVAPSNWGHHDFGVYFSDPNTTVWVYTDEIELLGNEIKNIRLTQDETP